jgi:hypothetical protein
LPENRDQTPEIGTPRSDLPALWLVEKPERIEPEPILSCDLLSSDLWHSRKEVIQPQVPLRLPCYDFTPVADLTVVG